MKKQSAGLLLYRFKDGSTEVLLVHPGGPFWAKRDLGAWSIPKGEFEEDEEPLAAAKREFQEEMGVDAPEGEVKDLGSAKQSTGKVVYAWAMEADLDTKQVKSNLFEMEWPPRSGRQQEFPEVDKAEWFTLDIAKTKLVKGQVPLLESLATQLGEEIQEQEESPSAPSQTSLL